MSVASEFEIERQLITNAYNKLDNLGIDSTGVDKNIENISEMLDTVYEEYPKVTGTGTEITLNGTKVGKLSLDIKGNSTQETTEGYNIMNFDVEGQNSNVTVNDDGTITINGKGGFSLKMKEITLEANQTYRQKIEIVSGNVEDNIFNALLSFKSNIWLTPTTYVEYTPTENETKSTIWLNASKTFNNCRLRIWGYKGTDDKPFEKATDGASPNPSYPKPIYSAGDKQDIFKNPTTLNAYISATGVISSSNEDRTVFVKCKPNKTYIINKMLSVPTSSNHLRIGTSTSIPAIGTQLNDFIRYDSGNTITEQEITTSTNANYLVIFLYNTSSTTTLTEMLNSVKVIEKQGTISEKIVNKNWFPKNISFKDNYYLSSDGVEHYNTDWKYSDYIEIIGKSVTLTRSSSAGSSISIIAYNSNKEYITGKAYKNQKTVTVTSNEDIAYVRISLSRTLDNLDDIQLELGSSATTYTAHQEQTYTIPVQQPMRSIGTVRDEFIKVDGKWFERHNIARHIFTGNENGMLLQSINSYGIANFYVPFENNYTNVQTFTTMLSNYFTKQDTAISTTQTEGFLPTLNSSINVLGVYFRIFSSTTNTLDLFKTWLQNNQTHVDYVLATPTDLPCTEEQISILENLPTSYNEQTNIYSLDVTPAYIEAKALKGE